MSESSKFDRIVSIVLTMATLAVVALLLERRLAPPGKSRERPVYVNDWRERVAAAGRAIGDSGGIVTVAVFTDFECPFCRRMDSTLTALAERFPGKVARVVVHLPISQHRFARPAAFAFECALKVGHAEQMHKALYSAQDSLGTLSWAQYAMRAGIQDSIAFTSCITAHPDSSMIAAGERQARELKVSSTPTVLVNGWKFDPSLPEDIDRAVTAAVQGKTPNSVR